MKVLLKDGRLIETMPTTNIAFHPFEYRIAFMDLTGRMHNIPVKDIRDIEP